MQIRVVGERAVVAKSTAALPVVPAYLLAIDHLRVVQGRRHFNVLLQYRAFRAFRLDERIGEHGGAQHCRCAIEVRRWKWKLVVDGSSASLLVIAAVADVLVLQVVLVRPCAVEKKKIEF